MTLDLFVLRNGTSSGPPLNGSFVTSSKASKKVPVMYAPHVPMYSASALKVEVRFLPALFAGDHDLSDLVLLGIFGALTALLWWCVPAIEKPPPQMSPMQEGRM